MSDFRIVSMMDGGARIYESTPGLVENPPHKTFEISKDRFEELKQIIAGMENQ
ncbi:MAG: hypothetical protein M0Q91_05210 [Methanoregula sp.]|jgi:hypothetical protein|nr:hypothetical protein [Methanoregula sp.]